MIKTSANWAILSLTGLLAGCTVTTTNSDDAGVGSTATSTTGSTTATSTTSGTGTSTSSTGGITGGTTGGVMGVCETCAYSKCNPSATACEANAACHGGIDDYYACLSNAAMNVDDCGMNFLVAAGDPGSSAANDLISCITGNDPGGDGIGCTDTCKASGDAGTTP